LIKEDQNHKGKVVQKVCTPPTGNKVEPLDRNTLLAENNIFRKRKVTKTGTDLSNLKFYASKLFSGLTNSEQEIIQ
jgi:hypothetical protein